MSRTLSKLRPTIRRVGLVAGPVLAVICYLALPHQYTDPSGAVVNFDAPGRATLAVMVWMAAWWLTEAISLSATAILPLVLFPVLGVGDMRSAAAPYANPLIFLFMGGFILALAMQRWQLDRRIALLTLRVVGAEPTRMVGGFMLATAVLSMFVSNTATTAMMLPIGLSVIGLVRPTDGEAAVASERHGGNFSVCLMLGIAYAASIGGIGTIIGTPPNALLVGFVRDSIDAPHRMDISFARWLGIGLPLVAVFLPVVWLLLTRVVFPVRLVAIEGGGEFVRDELRKLGPAGRGEWTTCMVFAATAAAWILRPVLVTLEWPAGSRPLAGLSDAGIAMGGALLLFVLPVEWRSGTFAMNWETAKRLPWGILLLFGGGLSLASAVQTAHVGEFIGSGVGALPDLPTVGLVLVVATLVIFLTELTSNTATTATLLPILAALAPGLGAHPYMLIFPATLAASCAFMMPVATPPNALVFGSGHVTIRQMVKAGLWLNFIGVILITLLARHVGTWVLTPVAL
jgi:sodium-dependent dicarboxylate transporter 2/3/5